VPTASIKKLRWDTQFLDPCVKLAAAFSAGLTGLELWQIHYERSD
jgi:hypothetical protein